MPVTPHPMESDADRRRHAAAVAKQLAVALRHAEALRTGMKSLAEIDPNFAATWSEMSERAATQVASLTAALEWAHKAAKGKWRR